MTTVEASVKKVLLGLLSAALGLSLLMPAAGAAPIGPRSVEEAYDSFSGVVLPNAEAHQSLVMDGVVFFKPLPGERHVSLAITDAAGGEIFAGVFLDRNGDGYYRGNRVEFCGSTTAPLLLPRKTAQIAVELYQGTCPAGTPSVVTNGTVTARFTR